MIAEAWLGVRYRAPNRYDGKRDASRFARCTRRPGVVAVHARTSYPPRLTVHFRGSAGELARLDACLPALPNVAVRRGPGPAADGCALGAAFGEDRAEGRERLRQPDRAGRDTEGNRSRGPTSACARLRRPDAATTGRTGDVNGYVENGVVAAAGTAR